MSVRVPMLGVPNRSSSARHSSNASPVPRRRAQILVWVTRASRKRIGRKIGDKSAVRRSHRRRHVRLLKDTYTAIAAYRCATCCSDTRRKAACCRRRIDVGEMSVPAAERSRASARPPIPRARAGVLISSHSLSTRREFLDPERTDQDLDLACEYVACLACRRQHRLE